MNKIDDEKQKNISYKYQYKFHDGSQKEFIVELDKKSLNLVETSQNSYPEWTELENCKCPNCPLNEDDHKYCPVAKSITGVIDFFRDSISYDEVDVTVETSERSYIKNTSLQQGVSSLLGLYMVTSGCPVLGKLKPMARHHLPFATLEETSYRALSMFLLAQYFTNKRGGEPDWNLDKLVHIYDEIQTVNRSFWKRLSHMKIQDASINALIILDSFAGYLVFKVDEDKLSDIDLLCEAYFE